MEPGDIAAGLRLCRASGWNQLEDDWRCFLDASPAGCFVALRDGRVVGSVATLRYADRFSWVSMVLVDPAFRDQGLGTQLFREALRELADAKTIKLDATPAGKRVYDPFGFCDEYRLSRMKLSAPFAGSLDACETRLMSASDLNAVMEWDREVFGADRSAILQRMYAAAAEFALVAGPPGAMEGYIFGRHGFNAEHLGPVVAKDEWVARRLLSASLAAHRGKRLLLDASLHSRAWCEWLESVGFREERPFIRMFRGANAFPGAIANQFAIVGPEFG